MEINGLFIQKDFLPKNEDSKQILTSKQDMNDSIFDINKNTIVDAGDFSNQDLENNGIKDFLNKYVNKEWTTELKNLISPLLNKSNSENLVKNSGKYNIQLDGNNLIITKGKKTTQIQITTDSTVTKNDLQNLLNSVGEFSPDEISDMIKEINGIVLGDEVGVGGRGFFDSINDKIELSTNSDNYGVSKSTLLHEVGHGVSARYTSESFKRNNFSYAPDLNERFGGLKGIDNLFNNLQETYGKFRDPNNTKEFGDGYALRNAQEFFAEYYVYKKDGVTGHESEKLFRALEQSDNSDIKDLLDIMNDSMKFSRKEENLRKKPIE